MAKRLLASSLSCIPVSLTRPAQGGREDFATYILTQHVYSSNSSLGEESTSRQAVLVASRHRSMLTPVTEGRTSVLSPQLHLADPQGRAGDPKPKVSASILAGVETRVWQGEMGLLPLTRSEPLSRWLGQLVGARNWGRFVARVVFDLDPAGPFIPVRDDHLHRGPLLEIALVHVQIEVGSRRPIWNPPAKLALLLLRLKGPVVPPDWTRVLVPLPVGP